MARQGRNPSRVRGGRHIVLQFFLIVLVLSIAAGCYAPLGTDSSAQSLSLDVSGFVGALQDPPPDYWVLDVYLFAPEYFEFFGDGIADITSRSDSVEIDGQRFARIVSSADNSWQRIEPNEDDLSNVVGSGTARIDGIPAGGPYVLVVRVWTESPNGVSTGWWVSSVGEDLVSFSVQSGRTTRLDGSAIQQIGVSFLDDPQ